MEKKKKNPDQLWQSESQLVAHLFIPTSQMYGMDTTIKIVPKFKMGTKIIWTTADDQMFWPI